MKSVSQVPSITTSQLKCNQVPEQLNRLGSSIEGLEAAVEELGTALSQILRERNPEPAQPQSEQEKLVSLAGTLRGRVEQIDSIFKTVRDITSRIEL